MGKILGVILSVVVTSFYIFPVYFKALPSVNTKMALAVLGLIAAIYDLIRYDKNIISKSLIVLSMWSLGVSLVSLITMIVNDTNDPSFLTYFLSVWVWLGGAYGMLAIIRNAYGKVSVKIIVNFIIAVCVCQCILAYLFVLYPALDNIVGNILGEEGTFMGVTKDRMHGFGASLDVAGFKFAAALTFTAVMIGRLKRGENLKFWIYGFSFIIIGVIGNMISRSTIIGLACSFAYWLYMLLTFKDNNHYISKLFLMILCFIPIIITLYQTNDVFRSNLRFGFEGFFSLIETGKWQSNSNDILKLMIVFPDNLKTWLIGDGYAANPYSDPYYVGPAYHGFYMSTDIGYIRYIFYFGIIGLSLLIGFFLKGFSILFNQFPKWKILFFWLLMVNFIEWFKVSSDLFCLMAPFLCLASQIESGVYSIDQEEYTEILN